MGFAVQNSWHRPSLDFGSVSSHHRQDRAGDGAGQAGGCLKGKDPQADKREAKAKAQAQIPLRMVIDNFLCDRQGELRPASFSELRRYLLNDWKPLHGWPIAEIQLPQVADILVRLKKAGPVSAARSRSCLSSCFKWAMGHGYVQHNLVIGTINPDTGAARDRVLND